MNRVIYVLLAAFLVGVTGCAAAPLAGGYSKAPVADKDVVAAAEFAVKAHAGPTQKSITRQRAAPRLLKIVAAEQQMVAGTNYRLKLKVEEDGHQKTVVAVVWWQAWRKPNPYELTSWQ